VLTIHWKLSFDKHQDAFSIGKDIAPKIGFVQKAHIFFSHTPLAILRPSHIATHVHPAVSPPSAALRISLRKL